MESKKQVGCITINTDASYSHQKGVGGYAFYIVCDLFKIQKSGSFKHNPKSALFAEMQCIANALHTLLAQQELPKFNLLVINCDCLPAFEHISFNSKFEVGKMIFMQLKFLRCRYEFRHVKAHNGIPDSRSWVNDWCDKEAKKMMRKAYGKVK